MAENRLITEASGLEIHRAYFSSLEEKCMQYFKKNHLNFTHKVELDGFLFDFYLPDQNTLVSVECLHDHSERYWEDLEKKEVVLGAGFIWIKWTSIADLKSWEWKK
ncbi:MAG: very-short-patch-repair endonuclease [Sphingobacteriales bacterium]|jgi:very-short-patch-repair endonuclease